MGDGTERAEQDICGHFQLIENVSKLIYLPCVSLASINNSIEIQSLGRLEAICVMFTEKLFYQVEPTCNYIIAVPIFDLDAHVSEVITFFIV